jgi:hypothetical protein
MEYVLFEVINELLNIILMNNKLQSVNDASFLDSMFELECVALYIKSE